jgi:hypothetical protein
VYITVPEGLFGVGNVDFGRETTVYRRLIAPRLACGDPETEDFPKWGRLVAGPPATGGQATGGTRR